MGEFKAMQIIVIFAKCPSSIITINIIEIVL